MDLFQGETLFGNYDAWCVDIGRNLGDAPFDVTTLCSYDPTADSFLDKKGNLDAVNWLLNQVLKGNVLGAASSCEGGLYTWSDVQRAIWSLLDNSQSDNGLVDWSECRAQALTASALANGEGFVPGCDEYVGILLLPYAGDVITRQITIIMVPANCDVPPPPTGCTRTQGYWRNHSEYGPAPYDATWAQLPNGADTSFFKSGGTYLQVIRTETAGNAYFTLARQYIAAQLNFLAGAGYPSDVEDAFEAATALLNTYKPQEIAKLKGSSAVRKQFVSLAAILDAYNNGLIGPGHCDDSQEIGMVAAKATAIAQ